MKQSSTPKDQLLLNFEEISIISIESDLNSRSSSSGYQIGKKRSHLERPKESTEPQTPGLIKKLKTNLSLGKEPDPEPSQKTLEQVRKERRKVYIDRYRLENRDKINKYYRDYYKKNSEKYKETSKAWRARNPEK